MLVLTLLNVGVYFIFQVFQEGKEKEGSVAHTRKRTKKRGNWHTFQKAWFDVTCSARNAKIQKKWQNTVQVSYMKCKKTKLPNKGCNDSAFVRRNSKDVCRHHVSAAQHENRKYKIQSISMKISKIKMQRKNAHDFDKKEQRFLSKHKKNMPITQTICLYI